MELLGALAAGVFIGSVLGFIGAGGAMLAVPILIYLFGYTPHHATTASLAIVGIAATSGAFAKARNREILYREAVTIWAIGLVTNIGFSAISDRLPDLFTTLGFSVVLFGAGLSMARKPIDRVQKRAPLWVLIGISLLIGSITGLFGIGGGFLAIPILVLFFGTPIATASGTSLAIIGLNSITALLVRYPVWDQVKWQVPAVMACAAVVISHLASHVGTRTSPQIARKAFAVLLLIIASVTFVQALLRF